MNAEQASKDRDAEVGPLNLRRNSHLLIIPFLRRPKNPPISATDDGRTKLLRSRSPTQFGESATVVLLARDAMKSRDRENHNDYTLQAADVCRTAVSKRKWLPPSLTYSIRLSARALDGAAPYAYTQIRRVMRAWEHLPLRIAESEV